MGIWPTLPFDKTDLENYLSTLQSERVLVHDVCALKDDEGADDSIKAFGYGSPLLVVFSADGEKEQRIVLHTMSQDRFGHKRRSDRARNLLLDYDTFNELPQHVPAIDVGAFVEDGGLISLGNTGEFFLIAPFVRGHLYAEDLKRISTTGELEPYDEARTVALADYLAEIHARKQPDPSRYKRCIRDLLGHGEGIMGMTDAYPSDFHIAPSTRLAAIEQQCIRWRWRINRKHDRLSRSHGDFHPWNVLFDGDDHHEFTALDRSRGPWGDPADDLSAMTVNYILFSVRQYGQLQGAFERLFRVFWERYLDATDDQQVQDVIAPFYAWRTLVVAHPVWYPDLTDPVREALFHFIESVLEAERFEPTRVNEYLGI
jgi:hypothetical protein